MGKRFSNLLKAFLERPTNSMLAIWLVGINSLAGCVSLGAYGFVTGGVGPAVLYGFAGWIWGAIQGVVVTAGIWILLKLVADTMSGHRFF